MTLQDALDKLRSARVLLEEHGVVRAGVFGSTARGEAGPDSDVDVLVEFDPTRVPGWEYFTLGEKLAAVLGRPVDVVTYKSLPEMMRGRVMEELVYA